MNVLERQLSYPLGDALPGAGSAMEVAAGVHWVRMPLPFALDHVNLWLLRDRQAGREGWTIVDCGIDDEPTRGRWEQVFASRLGGLPVLRVVVTHLHPDHIGLAAWICERWDCRVWISAADYHAACRGSRSRDAATAQQATSFAASHGLVEPAALAYMGRRNRHYADLVPTLPDSFRRLVDGDRIAVATDDWRCLVGYGHAPEHIALACEARQLLISGDMLLPRISTNISVGGEEPEADSLTRYLESIERMRALPADTLVLPSHGKPFRGLATRIDQLHAHHAERLADVVAACSEGPQSAADLLPLLFRRPLDVQQTSFALGESIAHLHALWLAGRLERRRGHDGVYRFSCR